jgi:predicted aldo/keto reductase-like oxidoreductase
MTSKIPTRQLGKNGPTVSALGFGAMGLSVGYGTTDSDEKRFELLDRAYELGETLWDSADCYGDSEDLIGKWFKRTGKRNDIFLATKFALVVGPNMSVTHRSDPEYVREACEKSLKRLGVDHIDLYYCHRVDATTPIEKTVEAMVKLKEYVNRVIRFGFQYLMSIGKERSNILDSARCLLRLCAAHTRFIQSPPSRSSTVHSLSTLRTQRLHY